jgi:hypothetical protein
MKTADELIEGVLLIHKDYNPAEAHAYYMRTRQLKGRKKGATPPLPKGKTKTLQEDEVPMTSPHGAKIVNFSGKNGGEATYTDGSVYGVNGWNSGKSTPDARLQAMHKQIASLETWAKSIKDPKARAIQVKRVADLKKQHDEIRRKHANAGLASVKQPPRKGMARAV